jgi:hypothetical protein
MTPNPCEGVNPALKKKFALFYILITSLCFLAFDFVLFHALGYRVNRSESLPGSVYRITPLEADEALKTGDIVLIDLSKISNPVIGRGMERGYVSRSWNQPMLKQIGAVPAISAQSAETPSLTRQELFSNAIPLKIRKRENNVPLYVNSHLLSAPDRDSRLYV